MVSGRSCCWQRIRQTDFFTADAGELGSAFAIAPRGLDGETQRNR